MDDIIEITELNDDMFEKKSTNFGGGLEFLMNDKVSKKSSSSADIKLDDLEALEDELNNLVDEGIHSKPKSNIFSVDKEEKPSVRFSSVGKSTADSINIEDKTWDGFAKFNNIPLNPDKEIRSESKLSNEEIIKEKFKYIKIFEKWEKKGVQTSRKYSFDDSLEEMRAEHDMILADKKKSNNVKYMGQMLLTLINGIEMLNSKFDPFDLKLDGFSEQVTENISDYDDIFDKLDEKYKDNFAIAPELELIFKIGSTAAVIHVTNSMFKSAVPGMDDILKSNPQLMRSFQDAVASSMKQSSPSFGGFMDNISSSKGPPPPVQTQGPLAEPPPQTRPGNNSYANRPDLSYSINKQFKDDRFMFSEPNPRQQETRQQETTRQPQPEDKSVRQKRPEMKGPSDLSNILSGLRTKSIDIQEPQTAENSTISINDLKDLQNEGNIPKRSRRKKSSSNTVSLDI
jgi:hypothetical protein